MTEAQQQRLGMAILPRPAPTGPDLCGYSPPRRGDGAVTGYKNCPDTQGGAPFTPPQIFFCPASLTPPPTNLPYTIPHAASHQPPSRSSSFIHAVAAPRSVTLQLLSSRRRSSLVTPHCTITRFSGGRGGISCPDHRGGAGSGIGSTCAGRVRVTHYPVPIRPVAIPSSDIACGFRDFGS
uniref:Uncharacterized protein n=1 Tax=Fagus sylvatica TaxID=28930 RepID=A0A2N9H5Y7_FAGSY